MVSKPKPKPKPKISKPKARTGRGRDFGELSEKDEQAIRDAEETLKKHRDLDKQVQKEIQDRKAEYEAGGD